MTDLTNAERETHFNMTADARDVWQIFSDDPVMQRRIEAVGATLVGEAHGAKFYTLPANQLTLRQPPKPMSEERKAELATQLRARAAAPVATDAKNRNGAANGDEVME